LIEEIKQKCNGVTLQNEDVYFDGWFIEDGTISIPDN
jgi:hypothetical protein